MRSTLLPALLFALLGLAASDGERQSPSKARERAASGDGGFALVTRSTVEVPAPAPEIVAVSADGQWVLATDGVRKSLEILQLVDLATTPRLSPFDVEPEVPGIQGVRFGHEPTSVAAHPTLALAFVVEIGARPEKRGQVHAIDLRAGRVGNRLWSRSVGHHPDSIAVAPNGRWIVAANEGEGDPRVEIAPGSIGVLALNGVDLFAADAPAKLVYTQLDPSVVLGLDAGVIEPEYVAFDPLSRFAVVTCQENDSAVVVDLGGAAPTLAVARFNLPAGAQPDGLAVLDGYVDRELGPGALVAFAEEGDEQRDGVWPPQGLSLYWLAPGPGYERTMELGRVDLVELLEPKDGRVHPESVVLLRRDGRWLAAVTVERAGSVVLFDVTDPRAPRHLSTARVGKRPEGLRALERGSRTWFVTGDEGEPGTISFVELIRR